VPARRNPELFLLALRDLGSPPSQVGKGEHFSRRTPLPLAVCKIQKTNDLRVSNFATIR
jgi:hypothetical protein